MISIRTEWIFLSQIILFGFTFGEQQTDQNEEAFSIPLELYVNISKMSNKMFIEYMLEPQNKSNGSQPANNVEEKIFNAGTNSVNTQGADSIASRLTREDGCNPRHRTVKITEPDNYLTLYWPTCTSLERCGGCCGHDSLECAPTQVEMTRHKVLKAVYPYKGAQRFNVLGTVDVLLEKHLACECRCRVQAFHCDQEKQVYLPDSCRCECKNSHMARMCDVKKKWDEDKCECVCARTPQCNVDEVFDQHQCQCIPKVIVLPTTEPPTTAPPVVSRCADHQCWTGYAPSADRYGNCYCIIQTEWYNTVGRNCPTRPVMMTDTYRTPQRQRLDRNRQRLDATVNGDWTLDSSQGRSQRQRLDIGQSRTSGQSQRTRLDQSASRNTLRQRLTRTETAERQARESRSGQLAESQNRNTESVMHDETRHSEPVVRDQPSKRHTDNVIHIDHVHADGVALRQPIVQAREGHA